MTLVEPALGADLAASGLGFDREVALAVAARDMGLFTIMYAFGAAQASTLANARADIIVIHLGITGVAAVPGDQPVAGAVAAVNGYPGIILLVHGGPVEQPADVARLQRTYPRIDGFFGVSSIERIPVQAAVAHAVTAFAYPRGRPPS